jgi:hypothetical protein
MENKGASRKAGVGRETRSLTLADLLLLVVGFALVFSLPWLTYPGQGITVGRVRMPGWTVWLYILQEAAAKVGVILAPAILARRIRYGGLPRPGDWLGLVVAWPVLSNLIVRSGWTRRFARWFLVDLRSAFGYAAPFFRPGNYSGRGFQYDGAVYSEYEGFPSDFTPGDEDRIWGEFAVLLLLVIAALGRRWKRLPDWACTTLLWLAGFIWCAGVRGLIRHSLGQASRVFSGWTGMPSDIPFTIACAVGMVPQLLLLTVPFVAVLFELRIRASRTWTWTEWVGTIMGFLWLASTEVVERYSEIINLPDPECLTWLILQPLQWAALGAISWNLVKHARRAEYQPADS